MWYPATVTTAAASEPVTLAQAKAQCGITSSDYDTQLTSLIAAARAMVENYCGIKLVTQTIEVKCDCFADFERLANAPLQSVTSISYVDTAGTTQTIAAEDYEVRKEGLAPSIVTAYGVNWPVTRPGSRITMIAVVGYEEVPDDIQNAILLIIGKQFSLSGRDLFIRSETVEGVGATQWGGTAGISEQVEKAAYAMLEHYRNWPLA